MQHPSVLLVEDDAFQRKAAETYLMNHDLRVIAVENGAQMRRQISRSMPDLVLLDVQLPAIRSTRCWGLKAAPTTTSPSPTSRASFWRAARACCAVRPTRQRRRC